MKTECGVVRDLLPLYLEDMVSEETRSFVKAHLEGCPECEAALAQLRSGTVETVVEESPNDRAEQGKSFKRIMRRMRGQFHSLSYLLIVFFIFLGFSWTGGENLMYNSLIMPVVGVFGYCVFRWRAVYKVPVLLLVMDLLIFAFQLIEIDLYSTVVWTGIYSIFVVVGIAIAFLLHVAFGKERKI